MNPYETPLVHHPTYPTKADPARVRALLVTIAMLSGILVLGLIAERVLGY